MAIEIQKQIKYLPTHIFNSWTDNKDVSVREFYGHGTVSFLMIHIHQHNGGFLLVKGLIRIFEQNHYENN